MYDKITCQHFKFGGNNEFHNQLDVPTDGNGLPLHVILTAGNRHESTQFAPTELHGL